MNEEANLRDGERAVVSLSDRVRSLKIASPPPGSSRARLSWLPWLMCVLLAGGCAYLGYVAFWQAKPESGSDDAPAAAAGASLPGLPSPTQGANAPPGSVVLDAGGYIIPVQTVQVSPKVGGQVIWLYKNLEEGTEVEEGIVLAKLDPIKYRYEYERTKALMDTAKAEWEELKNGNRPEEVKHAAAQLKEAEEARKQLQDELFRLRQSGRGATDDERIKVESRLRQAEQRVVQLQLMDKVMQDGPRKEKIEAAWARYQQSLVQMNNAKYDLDNTEVRSPVTGVILVKKTEVGNTVRPESFGQGLSASLCDMADLDKLEVDVDVSERELDRVYQGQKCKVRPEAFSGREYEGTVSRLMPTSSRSKASVSVRVRIIAKPRERDERGGLLLRPEMRARVLFLAAEKSDTK
jgi:multidrug resistance efflux pump